jgi:hypothetical protein
MLFACLITKAKVQTHANYISWLLLLHGNMGYENALQSKVICNCLSCCKTFVYLIYSAAILITGSSSDANSQSSVNDILMFLFFSVVDSFPVGKSSVPWVCEDGHLTLCRS